MGLFNVRGFLVRENPLRSNGGAMTLFFPGSLMAHLPSTYVMRRERGSPAGKAVMKGWQTMVEHLRLVERPGLLIFGLQIMFFFFAGQPRDQCHSKHADNNQKV